jgi:demethylmenaquinone methyltransferase / 2-methoxy-6-polyprenyl-1,4-benzoquinol methylase
MPDTKKTFDSISSNYDIVNQLISFGLHKKWKSDFVKLRKFSGNVIDIATGTGDIAIKIKSKYPNVAITGYDPSNNMLNLARKKNVNKNINFMQGFCEDMPFENEFFDFATITFGIRNTKSVNESLTEIRRVLKKNGILMIMEFSKNETIIIKQLYKIYLHWIIPFIGLLFSKFNEYKYLADSIEGFYSKDEMNKILEFNDFKVMENVQYNFGLVTVYIVMKS